MRVVSRGTLRNFWDKHPEAAEPLKAWFAEAKRATWSRPIDIKRAHRSASFVGKDRVVFNIKGNAFRLIVAMDYSRQAVFIKFVGTHRQYDDVDVATVGN